MITVFLKVLIVFLMIGTGFLANKKGVLPSQSSPYLVNLLLIITSPCLIISSMVSSELTPDLFQQTIEVIIGSLVFFILSMLLSLLIVKLLKYQPREDSGVLMVIMTALNTGFMGFPITKAIFGDRYLFLMVMFNIVLNIYLYLASIIQMNYGSHEKSDFKSVIGSAINLCTISSFIGLGMLLLHIKFPPIFMEFFKTVGDATIPISMLVVGVQLADRNLKAMIKNIKLVIASVVNVALMPALTFVAVEFLPIATDSKVALVFATSMPCAVAVVGVAAMEKKNAHLMAEGVALTTAMSMVSLPLWASFLLNHYGLS